MRLRRETGDFQIKLTPNESEEGYAYNTIRPGLMPEDFVGETIYLEDGSCKYELIVSAELDEDDPDKYVELCLYNLDKLKYNRNTGEITGGWV